MWFNTWCQNIVSKIMLIQKYFCSWEAEKPGAVCCELGSVLLKMARLSDVIVLGLLLLAQYKAVVCYKNVIVFYQVLQHKRVTSGSGSILEGCLARLRFQLSRSAHRAAWKKNPTTILLEKCAKAPSACNLTSPCRSQMGVGPLCFRKDTKTPRKE